MESTGHFMDMGVYSCFFLLPSWRAHYRGGMGIGYAFLLFFLSYGQYAALLLLLFFSFFLFLLTLSSTHAWKYRHVMRHEYALFPSSPTSPYASFMLEVQIRRYMHEYASYSFSRSCHTLTPAKKQIISWAWFYILVASPSHTMGNIQIWAWICFLAYPAQITLNSYWKIQKSYGHRYSFLVDDLVCVSNVW